MEYTVKSRNGVVTVGAHDHVSAARQVACEGENDYVVKDRNGKVVVVDLAVENRKGRRHPGGDL